MSLTLEQRERGQKALILANEAKNKLRAEGKVPGRAVIPVNEKYRIEFDGSSWQVSCFKASKSDPDGGRWSGLTWHMNLHDQVAIADLAVAKTVGDAFSAASRLIASAQEVANEAKAEVAKHG